MCERAQPALECGGLTPPWGQWEESLPRGGSLRLKVSFIEWGGAPCRLRVDVGRPAAAVAHRG
jgi:hypothetical protein